MELARELLANPVAVTFVVIALGMLLGRIKIAGLSVGVSGVLFTALLFGHFRWADPDPLQVLGDFGVVLFVYAVGLQAGPKFVRTLRAKGWAPISVALATIVGAAVLCGLIGRLVGLEPAVIVGLFAGTLTSTPALAAGVEACDSPLVSVAYGVAYPVGVVGVVLFAQLAPRMLRSRLEADSGRPDLPSSEAVHRRTFAVQNPGCVGRRISELKLRELASASISRVFRGEDVLPSSGDPRLEDGDVVLAVGTEEQLDRLSLLIGPPVPAEVELLESANVVARDIYVTEAEFAGRSLRELSVRGRFNVVITRVRREDIEVVPRGDFVPEVGDQIRAVGYEPDVVRFAQAVGIAERRIHETGIPSFAAGLVIGLVLAFTPLPVPFIGDVKLGLAGGPLFVGILLGHFGRIGRLRVYVPMAARYLMRELGLVLFLVAAGVRAGTELWGVLQSQGVALVTLSLLVVVFSIAIGFGLAFWLFGQSVASALGMTCGAMTSTPGLGAAAAQFESDAPSLAYAAVYPLALVVVTVGAQFLVRVLA